MARLLIDNRDIKFVLFELLKVQEICKFDRFADWNEKSLVMLLDEAQKFSEKVLFPLNIDGDKIGLKFESGQVTSIPGTKKAYQDFHKTAKRHNLSLPKSKKIK